MGGGRRTAGTRTVVADDAGLLRAGIVNLLAANGFDVVAEAADFDGVIDAVERHRHDLLITDIRVPPTNTDEGIRAALTLWPTHAELAVLVLSQYVEARAAVELLEGTRAGVGYLLKERVTEVSEFVETARTVLAGQAVIDPTVAERMMARRSNNDALARLSGREARSPRSHGDRGIQLRHRRIIVRVPEDGRDTRQLDPHQTRPARRPRRQPPSPSRPPLPRSHTVTRHGQLQGYPERT